MKKLKSESGYSIIEMMVVTGVIGIIGLAMSQIMKSNFESIRAVETKLNARQFVDIVKARLKDPATCMETLAAANFASGAQQVSTENSTSLRRITLDGQNYAVTDDALPGLEITGLEVEGPRPAGSSDPIWNYLRADTASNIVSSFITVDFQASSGPAPRFSRRLPIHFQVDDANLATANISNCSSDMGELRAAATGPGILPPGAPPGNNIVSARYRYLNYFRDGCGDCKDMGIPNCLPEWANNLARGNDAEDRDLNRTLPPHDEFCDPNNLSGDPYGCRIADTNNGWRWDCVITDY